MKNYLRFLSPVLLLLAVLMGGGKIYADEVTYTVASKTSVTPSVSLTGVTTSFENNGSNDNDQLTGGKSMTLKISGFSGTVTALKLNLRRNKSTGDGNFSVNINGNNVLTQLLANGDLTKNYTVYSYNIPSPVETTGDIIITINAKTNSLYCNEFTLIYDKPGESKTKTSLTFPTTSYMFMVGEDVPVFSNKAILEPAAATGDITYTSDNENVAVVIDGDVTVDTNVEGTATIKAEYKGNDKYAPSSATYTIKVIKAITSIAALKKELSNTSRNFTLKLTDAVVSYTYGGRAYIQDATAGILLFIQKGTTPVTAGQKFNGFVNVAAQTFHGLPELTSWNPYSTMTTETTEELPLDVVTLEELKNNYDKYESCRVKVLGVTISKEFTDRTGEISQNGAAIDLRAGDAQITVTRNDIADIIGFPGVYDFAKQLDVWEQSAISPITVESLTPAASGYATYAADYAVNYSEQGLTAYAVKVATDKSKVSATPFTGVVPAGKAVLVKGTAGQEYTLTPATTAADKTFDTDLLASEGNVPADGAQHFAFGTKNGVSGFKLVKSGVVIPAKKGYLLISNAGAKEFFAFEGETTGISAVETAPAADGNVYNMAGQRVSKNYKGLVIVGGKKYLNK